MPGKDCGPGTFGLTVLSQCVTSQQFPVLIHSVLGQPLRRAGHSQERHGWSQPSESPSPNRRDLYKVSEASKTSYNLNNCF